MFALSSSPKPGGEATEQAALAQADPPNIVFILTDDMRKDDLRYMPKTKSLIQNRGTTFDNAFVTYSLCCPARTTFLRGQYAHNHRVLTNATSAHGSEVWFRKLGRDRSTVATWLHKAGYKTGFVGKYMNSYDDKYVPPGWDDWHALVGKYHKNLRMNDNGSIHGYSDGAIDSPIARKSVKFLRKSKGPFFLEVASHAPHSPNDYLPEYQDRFAKVHAPRSPSYNEKVLSDKPGYIQSKDSIGKVGRQQIDAQYRDRLRQLLTVDDMVGSIVDTLRAKRRLNNTYIVFTSDNGWHAGEHRLLGKWTPYEEAIRIPLVVRGPGVSAGERKNEMVINNDFAPTFADIGGADTPNFVDGSSLVPLLRGEPVSWRKRFMVESWHANLPSSPPTYQAVRTTNKIYTEYRAGGKVVDRELYSLRRDPYQLNSIHRTKNRKLVRGLDRQLSRLATCKGEECRAAEGW